MFISQAQINLAYCIFLTIIVGLLLIVLSRQPIDVYITSEKLTEELCGAKENDSNKKEAREENIRQD